MNTTMMTTPMHTHTNTIEELQRELTSAIDFYYPAWWGEVERQQHRDRIARLKVELDEAKEAAFWDVLMLEDY